MVGSKATSPHAYTIVEVDYENVERVRQAHRDSWKAEEGFSLTYLPFVARAVCDALAEFPHLNASVGEGQLIVHKYIDLGIAVDLGYQGLLVPVVRDADTKRLRALAREIADLGNRAKARKLSPDEIQGGTFTISNNGSAGSVLTMAIINQPQVAIVSTDAIKRRPVVVDLPDGSEGIAVHSVGTLATVVAVTLVTISLVTGATVAVLYRHYDRNLHVEDITSQLGTDRPRWHQHVAEIGPHAEGVHGRVLEEQQVVLGALLEQAALQVERLAVRNPAQPADVEAHR